MFCRWQPEGPDSILRGGLRRLIKNLWAAEDCSSSISGLKSRAHNGDTQMTMKQAFPRQMAQAAAAGFRFLNLDEINVGDFRNGNQLVMRTQAEVHTAHGEMIRVPLQAALTFGRPEPVIDSDN